MKLITSSVNCLTALLTTVLIGCAPGGDSSKVSSADLGGYAPTEPSAVKESYNTDQSGYYIVLDDDKMIKASKDAVSKHFDPSKPTAVFFHGWRINNLKPGKTLTFNNEILKENAATTWRRLGWNFIAYNWIQYADDMNLLRVECKIWSDDCSGKRIQWLNSKGEIFEHDIKESLAQKAAREFDEFFSSVLSKDNELRFVGHSLGTQLSTATQASLAKRNIKVDRLALTDLTTSNGRKKYLNQKWIGEQMRHLAQGFEDRGGALESYRCWNINLTPAFDANAEFDAEFLTINRKMNYLNFTNQDSLHRHCFVSYLSSIDQDAGNGHVEDFSMAATSTDMILKLRGKNLVQDNNDGSKTPDPSDDKYHVKGE